MITWSAVTSPDALGPDHPDPLSFANGVFGHGLAVKLEFGSVRELNVDCIGLGFQIKSILRYGYDFSRVRIVSMQTGVVRVQSRQRKQNEHPCCLSTIVSLSLLLV
jgi:hypothetical protein